MKNYGIDLVTNGKSIPKGSKGKVMTRTEATGNHKVSMRDTGTNKEHTIAEDLSLYEAYSMVVDYRSEHNGNYYWIGGKRRHA